MMGTHCQKYTVVQPVRIVTGVFSSSFFSCLGQKIQPHITWSFNWIPQALPLGREGSRHRYRRSRHLRSVGEPFTGRVVVSTKSHEEIMESQVVLNGFNGLKYEAISAISTFKTHVFFSTRSMPSLWGSKLSLDPESAASFLELCFQPWTSHEFSSVPSFTLTTFWSYSVQQAKGPWCSIGHSPGR